MWRNVLFPFPLMQALRFRVPPNTVPPPLLRKSFFASWGRIPRPAEITIEGDELVVHPDSKGSGTLHTLWPHRLLGATVESTDSLLPRSRPYSLPKELGRGALGRLQKKMFDWQSAGFRPSDELVGSIHEASRCFSKAATADDADPEVEKELIDLLEQFGRIALEASKSFAAQALAWRMRSGEKISVDFGIGISTPPIETLYEFDLYAKFLREAFHVVLPMPSWRELEPQSGVFQWELLEERLVNPIRFGFNVVMGPLLDFNLTSLPTWLLPNLHEPGVLEERAARFVNAITEKYNYLADSWILATKVNSHDIPELSTSRGIGLVRTLAGLMRSRSVDRSILVGVDQPWGEYALWSEPEWDMFQVAEQLAGIPEADSLLIELHIGLDAQSTFPRDPLAVASMIDQWSILGKKIYVSFSVPSVSDADPLDTELAEELQWSEGLQQLWTETLLTALLPKRNVHGVFWTQLQDIGPDSLEDTKTLAAPMLAFRGLIDAQRTLKLVFKQFTAFRQAVVK